MARTALSQTARASIDGGRRESSSQLAPCSPDRGHRDSFPGGVADLGDPTHRGRQNHMDRSMLLTEDPSGCGAASPSQGRWDPDSLRPALRLGGQASAWKAALGALFA